jgi:hypothetical protein
MMKTEARERVMLCAHSEIAFLSLPPGVDFTTPLHQIRIIIALLQLFVLCLSRGWLNCKHEVFVLVQECCEEIEISPFRNLMIFDSERQSAPNFCPASDPNFSSAFYLPSYQLLPSFPKALLPTQLTQ